MTVQVLVVELPGRRRPVVIVTRRPGDPRPRECDRCRRHGNRPRASSRRAVARSIRRRSWPLWIGPYLERDPDTSIWRYRYTTGLRGSDGWAVKFLWQLARTVTGPAQVSVVDVGSGRPLTITVAGSYVERSTAPLLDPARPGHADPFDQHPETREWGSHVVFPQAGCYRLDAQWPGGSWSLVFSFGR